MRLTLLEKKKKTISILKKAISKVIKINEYFLFGGNKDLIIYTNDNYEYIKFEF
jgi:hypothetical protein